MPNIVLKSKNYSDVDRVYFNHDGVYTELDTILTSYGSYAYRKLPCALSSTSSDYSWDDIQYASPYEDTSSTFVHLAKKGSRPNSNLDKFLVCTEDDIKVINTASLEIYARCELYSYKTANDTHLLIFTYKSTDSSDCALARANTLSDSIADYENGSNITHPLYQAHLYDYSLATNSITDIIDRVTDIASSSEFVLDSCCSAESGITVITGYLDYNMGRTYTSYSIFNIRFDDNFIKTTVLYDNSHSIEGGVANSFYPYHFLSLITDGTSVMSYHNIRLYSCNSDLDTLFFIPVNIDDYFVINNTSEYMGRCLYSVHIQNEYTVDVNRYTGSFNSPYVNEHCLLNRELNTMHQINNSTDKNSAGGLQSAIWCINNVFDSMFSNAYIDFAPRYVLDAKDTRELLSFSCNSHWFKVGYVSYSQYPYYYRVELAHYISTSSSIPISLYDNDKVKLHIVDNDSYINQLVDVCKDVENGRDVLTTDIAKKYVIIPFDKYYLVLYNDGYSVIIG